MNAMHASGLFACLPDSCLYAFIRSPHAALSLARFASGWMTRRLSLRRDLDLVVAVVAVTMRSHSLCFRGLFRFFPYITVWGSCFSLGSRRGFLLRLPPPPPPPPPLHLHSSLTHSLTHSLTVQIASWLPFVWHAQYTESPGGAAARVAAAGAAAAFRVAGAVYTEPPGRAAARVAAAGAAAAFRVAGAVHFRVAGAVHRASSTSCGARGRGAAGPRLPFKQAQYTEPPAWTSCGGRGRRWGRGFLSRGRRST